MDAHPADDGFFLAGHLDVGAAPSPWLRLAHHQGYDGGGSDRAGLRHIRDHEFIIQDSGDSWLAFADPAGLVALPEGCVALIPPGLLHAQGHTRSAHFAVHFDLRPDPSLGPADMVRSIGRRIRPSGRALRPWLAVRDREHRRRVPLVQRPAEPDWWRQRVRDLSDTWLSGRHELPGERLRCAGIIAELLHAFAFGTSATPAAGDAAILDLLGRIDPCRPGTGIAELARRAGCGETAFRAGFRRLTGTTPRDWLEARRCERALVLLQQSRLSIRAVAAACGYEDPYHFSRVIRRRYGRPPRDLRD